MYVVPIENINQYILKTITSNVIKNSFISEGSGAYTYGS